MSDTESQDSINPANSTTHKDENAPKIEEDIVKEKLRIDGICGIY